MNDRILLVVGDKFAPYIAQKEAITVSQLHGLLSLPVHILGNQERTVLVPGQGIGDMSRQRLLEAACQSSNISGFDFSLWHNLPERASGALSHKAEVCNVLVSMPRQVSAREYELALLIDEDCELMKDHLSGQHVQGMVVIEAARQAMLVVTEAYLMPKSVIDYAFVFNALSVSYSHYAFPISATIRTHITECAVDNPKFLKFAAITSVEQCGRSVAEFTMSFSAMEKSRLVKQERMQSVKAHRQFVAVVASDIAVPEVLIDQAQ
jgi:hypothetical protein